MKFTISKSQWIEAGKKCGWFEKTAQKRPITNEEVTEAYNRVSKAIKEDPDHLFSNPDVVYIIEYTEDSSKLPILSKPIRGDFHVGDKDIATRSSYYAQKDAGYKFKLIGKTTYQELRDAAKWEDKVCPGCELFVEDDDESVIVDEEKWHKICFDAEQRGQLLQAEWDREHDPQV